MASRIRTARGERLMAADAFPNYTQISTGLSLAAWHAVRVASVAAALAVAGLLIAAPDTGLFVMWELVIPLLPLLFLVAPGVWRNLCPLAASNQLPRALGFTRGKTAPRWLQRYGYVIAISLFTTFVALRKLGLDEDGAASALLLLGALGGGFAGGMALKGKSGWCSSLCPLLPVQRIYGQAPFALVGNSHCQPCVGCTNSCYDFNPRAAYLADLHDADPSWRGYRTFFVGAFPGLVLAFFAVPDGALGRMALSMAVSVAAFHLASTFVKVSAHVLTTLWGAAAFNIFYWYAGPGLVESVSGASPAAVDWALHAAVLALTVVWVLRTWRMERPFLRQARPVSRSLTSHRALSIAAPEVTFVPEGKRVAARKGVTLLEVAEANGMPIESGCRMGVCGADPVAIKDGMDHLSPVGDDERSTLDRLGLAPNTRMACCCRVSGPVSVSLTPDKPERLTPSRIHDFTYDRSIERVVVIGNGIAGVTAADHVRRRHPVCHIDLVADETHPLYNRMGITRLIHGRSAMQGLYLNPDSWYQERAITTWLNTRVRDIDRGAREVVLGTGEHLRYDRLVLAMGSSSTVPPIDGFGVPGTHVLRTAEDAMDIRAYAQRHGSRQAVVAGGGLLGLEAAYALHQLGLRTVVLERSERLLRRQLDDRAAALLRRYIEGLGVHVVMGAETGAVQGNGRMERVLLRDGRAVAADVFLVCAGITPNVELARAARLWCRRGVQVDDRMRTNDPRVFAAGDVAEHRHRVYGLWPTAVEQAEVAADNAVGGDLSYRGSVPVTMLKVMGVDLTSIGRFEPGSDCEEVIAFEEPDGQRYRKLVVGEDGRIAGAILLGHAQEVSPVVTAVKRGLDVRGTLAALRTGDWGALNELTGDRPLAPAASMAGAAA